MSLYPLTPAQIAYQEAHINETLQPNIIAATAVCMTAAYTAVALRFISRSVGRVKLGKDDYSIIIALVI